jgi:hypothetical protein
MECNFNSDLCKIFTPRPRKGKNKKEEQEEEEEDKGEHEEEGEDKSKKETTEMLANSIRDTQCFPKDIFQRNQGR